MTSLGVDLAEDILALKRERNAVILAHNYQVKEIQELADYVGDSLGLSYKAAETDADVIAFCGVHFMAETAKIVNPHKTVVLPDLDAGCSLERVVSAGKARGVSREHADKNYYVIAYINCSAGVKALSDVICTSGNAVKIVERRAEGSKHPLRARSESRRVGDGADRPPDGAVAGQLLRARRVHARSHRAHPRGIPGRAGRRASGMHVSRCGCSPTKCARRKRWSAIAAKSRASHHHRDRSGHAASAATRDSGQDFHPRADGSLRLRRLPFHEDEHARETARRLLNLAPEIILPEPIRARAELPIRRMLELSK